MVFFSRPSFPLPTLPSLGIHHLFTPFSFLFQRGLEAVTLPQSLIPCRYHLPLSNHRSLALPLIKPTWKCGMLVYQGHIFILTSLGICKVVVFFFQESYSLFWSFTAILVRSNNALSTNAAEGTLEES